MVTLTVLFVKKRKWRHYFSVFKGLCPDWEDWDPKKAKNNAKEAMDAAEKWLDVPQVGIGNNLIATYG